MANGSSNKNGSKVVLSTSGASFEDVIAVARFGAKVELDSKSIAAMSESRAYIEKHASGDIPVYGVSTGFGALATRHIDVKDRVQLQKSLIRSHAAGMGPDVEKEVVRAP